jgi:hypothetical protein
VNRRTFCLALAAMSCGPPPVTKRRVVHAPPDPKPKDPVIVDRVSIYTYTGHRSPLAVHDDVLVVAASGVLERWDLLAMKRLESLTVAHDSYCFMQDGTLAIYAIPPGTDHGLVYRVDPIGAVQTLFGPYDPKVIALLPAHGTRAYYGVREDDVVLLTEDRGRVVIAASAPRPERGSLFYSLDDGRIVTLHTKVNVIEAGRPPQTYAMAPRIPLHVAPATNDRCWYSTGERDERIHSLILARLTTPTIVEQQIELGPSEHIVHIASHGDTLAVFVFWTRAGTTTPDDGFRWAILVFGDDGTARWRAEVPPAHTAGTFVDLSAKGFVAVSEHRIVLRGLRGVLMGWDAKTGAPIPPART